MAESFVETDRSRKRLSGFFELKRRVVSSFEILNIYRYTQGYCENRKSLNFDRLTLHEGCLEDYQNFEISRDRVASSQTCVYCLFRPAQLTLDLAAPVEGAGAPLDYRHLLSFVASAATHQVAAVDADARVVALSPMCAQDAEFGILLAERRRWLYIDEILLSGRLMLRIVRL